MLLPPLRGGLATDAFSASSRREKLVGVSRFELLTPRLSSVCSNQLSYRPVSFRGTKPPRYSDPCSPLTFPPRRDGLANFSKTLDRPGSFKTRQNARPTYRMYQIDLECDRGGLRSSVSGLRFEHWALSVGRGPLAVDQPIVSRKEVIQPQVLLQLPCYDFTPITDHTLGTCLPCGLAGLLLVQPAFVM